MELKTTKDMGLEHVEIGLAGKAGELLFEKITASEGRRVKLHSDSCADDCKRADLALKHWGAEDERQRLLDSAYECLVQHQAVWEDIAALVMQRMGHQEFLSKQEVESLPSVQELIKNKRPL